MAKDPVCGMEVDQKACTYESEYGGQIYFFCSRGCLLDFQEKPSDFVEEHKPQPGRFAMASSQTPLVEEVMAAQVHTVSENVSLVAAAKKMSDAPSGCLIVVNKQGQAIGILTETDIVTRVVAKALPPARLKVRYAMSSPLITIDPKADILQAAREMTHHHVKRLVVLEKGKLAGIITMSDLVRVTPAVVGLLSELAQLR